LGVIIIFCIVGIITFFFLRRENHAIIATPSPTVQKPVFIDSGKEVESIDVAEADPAAVFRLNISNQAPLVTPNPLGVPASSSLVSDHPVPATNYVSSSLFSSLTNLTLLNLTNDDLASVPPEIGSLQNLQVLYLGNNQLTTLPPEIGNLSNLWMLSLFQNNLTSLPDTISQLKNLKILGLTGNPIVQSSTAMAQLRKELPNVQIIQ
jgi:Leucine-rich repeat (LRR) protein